MLNDLLRLLPVPKLPVDVDESMLQQIQTTLGTTFPSDFLEYSRLYGSGVITVGKYIWEIYSAFRPGYPQFVKMFHDINDEYRDAMETFHTSLGLFPEPGGLLPFGGIDETYFTWQTCENTSDWKIVVIWRYQENGYQKYDMGFTEFMVRALNREIKIAGFNIPWNPATDISFEPDVYGP